jgi:hypothetical protein
MANDDQIKHADRGREITALVEQAMIALLTQITGRLRTDTDPESYARTYEALCRAEAVRCAGAPIG